LNPRTSFFKLLSVFSTTESKCFGLSLNFLLLTVRLSDSTLAIFSPPPFTPSVQSALSTHFPDSTVSYLVAPDAEHYLYIHAWHSAFPSAYIIATGSLVEKFKGGKASMGKFLINITFPLKPDQDSDILEPFLSQFKSAYFPSAAKEIALLHKQSGTLLIADLIFNPPAREAYSLSSEDGESGVMTWLFGHTRGLKGSPLKAQKSVLGLIAGKGDERRRFLESVKEVAAWEVERFVPCHGEVVEGKENAQRVWRVVFQDLLEEERRVK
jgi:hypothetical protein